MAPLATLQKWKKTHCLIPKVHTSAQLVLINSYFKFVFPRTILLEPCITYFACKITFKKFESINAFESMNLQKHQILYFIKKTLLHNKMTTFDWSVIVIGSMGEATIIIIIIIKICLLMQKVKSPKLPPIFFLPYLWGGVMILRKGKDWFPL